MKSCIGTKKRRREIGKTAEERFPASNICSQPMMNPRCGCYLGQRQWDCLCAGPLRNSYPICLRLQFSIVRLNLNKSEVCTEPCGLKARGSLEYCRALYAAAATSLTSTFHWYWYTYSNPSELLETHAPVLESSPDFFLFCFISTNMELVSFENQFHTRYFSRLLNNTLLFRVCC